MICQECGMNVDVNEYHPYAACLIFKSCHDAEVTRANMDMLMDRGYRMAEEKSDKIGDAPVEEVLRMTATKEPALYMRFVTKQMMRDYT